MTKKEYSNTVNKKTILHKRNIVGLKGTKKRVKRLKYWLTMVVLIVDMFFFTLSKTKVLLGFIARDEVSHACDATKHTKCF